MNASILVYLPSFVKVVELASFSKAAQALGMTKSAVSKQVQALEDSLKVRLLNRTTRTVRLTDEGELLYQQARQIVDAANEAQRQVKNLNEQPSGSLKINAPQSFGILHLAPALAEFAKLYPEIQLEVDFTDKFINILEEGVDVTLRIASLTDSSLIARKIARCQVVFVAAPEYLKRFGTPKHPDELINHRFLEYSYIDRPKEVRWRNKDGTLGVITINSALRANNAFMLMEALRSGVAMGVFPTFIISDAIKAGEVVQVLHDFTVEPERNIYALFPHNRHMSAKVRLFIDFISERFGGAPYWEI
jgi:DNA-binding transcriptional LysR family regulator